MVDAYYEKQGVMIYQGLVGLKEAFDNVLDDTKEEYLVIALGNELSCKQLIDFFINYHKEREKRGIKVRLIADPSLQKAFQENYSFRKLFVKYSNVKLPQGTFIFGDNVMNIIWDEVPTAFILTSKKNAQKYREFFEDVWKFALTP